jgi:hypothetical protein
VRHLLDEDLDSFEKLEVMARVHKSNTGLDVDDVALDNEAMRWTVDELLRAHMIEKRARAYMLGPRGVEPAVAELMAIYDADRMLVVGELSSLAMERIRSMASKAFANAFVLRKKRGDDDG